MKAQHPPASAGASPLEDVCAAVATETGIPPGRVRKVLLAAQRYQQTGQADPPATTPALPTDPLRFYPLGANGRLHPPLHQPRVADADIPA